MATAALTETAKYVVIPLLAPAVGALIALRTKPNSQIKSLVRHITAGLVFAATAIELLPELLKDKQPLATVVGFVLGVGLLLLVNVLLGGHYHGDKDETEDHLHIDTEGSARFLTMFAATSVDVAIDGLLIGIAFAAGLRQGRVLLLALTIEVLFVGLSLVVASQRRKLTKSKSFVVAASPGIFLAAMALVGAQLLATLHGAMHQAILAFGIAALLYLVTEGLLVEAHEAPDEPIEVVGFFVGFLIILALALV